MGDEAGTVVGIDRTGRRVWDEGVSTIVFAMPIATPDGGVAVMRERDSTLLIFDEEGVLRTDHHAETRGPGYFGRFAVGPEGRIYALWRDGLTALCQDGGRVWNLVFEEVGGNNIHVEADGSIILEGREGMGPVRVSRDGEVSALPFPIPVLRPQIAARQTVGSTSLLVVASDIDRVMSYSLVYGTGTPWMVPDGPMYDRGDAGIVDALGGAWIWTATPAGPFRLRRYEGPDVLSFDRSDLAYAPRASELAEDGSLLMVAADLERRTPADGSVAWTVDLGPGFGAFSGALAPDGILYIGSTVGVFAVQTDVLPATVDYCNPPSCNGRRDGAVRLFH